MMKWLHKRSATHIDSFDLKKLNRVDKGAKENRRGSFEDHEADAIKAALAEYIVDAEKEIDIACNFSKTVTGCHLGFSLISGLRRGEPLQLRWCDVEDREHEHARSTPFDLIRVSVRGETSKVRKTRKLVVKDFGDVRNKHYAN